jgi:hypothetical protein
MTIETVSLLLLDTYGDISVETTTIRDPKGFAR